MDFSMFPRNHRTALIYEAVAHADIKVAGSEEYFERARRLDKSVNGENIKTDSYNYLAADNRLTLSGTVSNQYDSEVNFRAFARALNYTQVIKTSIPRIEPGVEADIPSDITDRWGKIHRTITIVTASSKDTKGYRERVSRFLSSVNGNNIRTDVVVHDENHSILKFSHDGSDNAHDQIGFHPNMTPTLAATLGYDMSINVMSPK